MKTPPSPLQNHSDVKDLPFAAFLVAVAVVVVIMLIELMPWQAITLCCRMPAV